MKLMIDSADVESIRRSHETFPLSGVTTNPSLLAKAGRPPYEVLRAIRSLIGTEELHVQVVGTDAAVMLQEAACICAALGSETYVKVPVTPEGLKAIKEMKQAGYRVTATCIYTQLQGYLAGQAGADYAAPYVNRIDNLGGDGALTAIGLQDLYRANGLPTQVLAASFKNCRQLLQIAARGVGAATLPAEILDQALHLDAVSAAVDAFRQDFEKLAGSGATMLF